MSGLIKLALNGAETTRVAFLGYKINADVRLVATVRPFIPQPNVAELVLIERIGDEVGSEELFKLIAKVTVGGCCLPELFQDRLNARRHVMCLFCSLVLARLFVKPPTESPRFRNLASPLSKWLIPPSYGQSVTGACIAAPILTLIPAALLLPQEHSWDSTPHLPRDLVAQGKSAFKALQAANGRSGRTGGDFANATMDGLR